MAVHDNSYSVFFRLGLTQLQVKSTFSVGQIRFNS